MAFVAGQTSHCSTGSTTWTDSLGVGTTSPETPITIVDDKQARFGIGTTDGEGLASINPLLIQLLTAFVSLVEACEDRRPRPIPHPCAIGLLTAS